MVTVPIAPICPLVPGGFLASVCGWSVAGQYKVDSLVLNSLVSEATPDNLHAIRHRALVISSGWASPFASNSRSSRYGRILGTSPVVSKSNGN
jgi:hypothetical protein